ncbi:MAG: hypothetical protein ACOC58_00940 [Chloroflexota bacterium]
MFEIRRRKCPNGMAPARQPVHEGRETAEAQVRGERQEEEGDRGRAAARVSAEPLAL